MPKKRPVLTRIEEAKARLERLQDEKRMEDLREKMRRRRIRRR